MAGRCPLCGSEVERRGVRSDDVKVSDLADYDPEFDVDWNDDSH